MNEEIKVHVVDYDRKSLYMRYRDPMTGRQHTRSTLTRRRRDAERAAAKWEAELREGRYQAPSRVTWGEFRERYEREVLLSHKQTSHNKACLVLGQVERILRPKLVRDLTADRLSHFQAVLRERGLAEVTIDGYLAYVRPALNWAEEIGMIPKAPKIKRPKRAKQSKLMKGRPITTEEYERMLDKAAGVVGESAAAPWRHYLTGLWLSGLRLAESLELYWDRSDRLCVDLTGEYPMLRIPAALEKGNQDRLLPMTPDFAEFLLDTPEDQRTGRVFKLVHRTGKPGMPAPYTVCAAVSAIGKAARIIVNVDAKGKVKHASAHDLRRSFGERWAMEVMPQVLMQIMRHENIETTLKYYVGRNAQTTAKVLWKALRGNTSGNTSPENSEISGVF